MTIRHGSIYRTLCGVVILALLLAGCGGGGGGGGSASSSTGVVKVSLTDAPTTELDHVWITVKEIRFHMSGSCEDPDDGGWLRYALPAPVTLDLAALNNGTWDTLWSGLALPVGNYQQIRLILAGTNDPLTPSADVKGLLYNNQVYDNGSPYPLVIPAAKNGIKLIGSFNVTSATPLHIVIDFDVTHDVVETGSGKYILKPRLKYFLVSTPETGAIVGTLLRPDGTPFANYTGVNAIIKAEAPETIDFPTSSTTVMGIKRATSVRPDGTFVLYPLPADTTYDLVIQGNGIRTMILRDVPADPGTAKVTPSMFDIELRIGHQPPYLVSGQVVNADSDPYEPVFGASVGFYQTLPYPGEIPYLIRFRHVNPLFGTFGDFPLPYGKLLVGTYDPEALIQSFDAVEPLEGPDSYSAYAAAPFFWPGGPKTYSPADTFNRFLLEPQDVNPPDCDLDEDHEYDDEHSSKGYYVVHDGLVIDHVMKRDLEDGKYDFESSNDDDKDIKSHNKGKPVQLTSRKPAKIKYDKHNKHDK
ncbi:hypothetical protein ANAEL_01602 [Anaerolineales bacterium]|nr:hypothetical protein ANAEL_01602 [Anaerolineales bacterium]